ncbi:MAG: NifU family protein [Bacillales bacterium]|nr:NifU family protein [Bacillales bacterium]
MDEYSNSIEMEIIEIIDKIRPFIQRDGGDVKLVKYENGIVYVKLYGACVGCVALDQTLKDGIESILKEEIPEVVKVVDVDNDDFNPEDPYKDIEIN